MIQPSPHDSGSIQDPFVCPCCGADATKLRVLADYIEALWQWRSDRTEAQDDLRQWADTIEDEAGS